MANPTVSAGLVAGLIDYATAHDADADELMADLQIDPEHLQDPDNRLPFIRYVELMRKAQKLTGDPALAMHWAEDVSLSEISILGLIMNASATMGEAFLQLQRYGRLAIEVEGLTDGPSVELTQKDGKLFMVHHYPHADAFPEFIENAFVRLVCGPRRFLSKPHVLAIHVTYQAPVYWREYERIFQTPVHFDSEWNAMEIPPDLVSWEIPQDSRYVFNLLTDRSETLIRKLDAKRSIRGQVEEKLLTMLHQGDISADAMAAHMKMSRQTLFRKLKEEGTSFSDILDDLRQQLAIQYLKGKKTSVNETAYLVGFSDPASFSRAFKRWTGQTPSEFLNHRPAK